jgi:predicted enzyme related to lactoylglutathione lyase
MHKSRLCYITIDINDFDRAVDFWSQALGAELEPFATTGNSDIVYRRLRLPDSDIRILLQLVSEKKTAKTRVHVDIETDDVEAEADRLEKLGAKRHQLMDERGFRFWVMLDPFGNEFCVLQPEYPDLLAKRVSWK